MLGWGFAREVGQRSCNELMLLLPLLLHMMLLLLLLTSGGPCCSDSCSEVDLVDWRSPDPGADHPLVGQTVKQSSSTKFDQSSTNNSACPKCQM